MDSTCFNRGIDLMLVVQKLSEAAVVGHIVAPESPAGEKWVQHAELYVSYLEEARRLLDKLPREPLYVRWQTEILRDLIEEAKRAAPIKADMAAGLLMEIAVDKILACSE